ncbi:MAG: DUF4166 domain-containing protein [Chloroflexi bacterium]|nr:DUF4166 domain-containing protein [Chloroflexota bacterium]
MADAKAGWACNSPIAQALGEDFHNLHTAVRKHYAEPTIEFSGTMDFVHVKNTIKPLAVVSYRLFHAPVPHSGRDVEVNVHNYVDNSGAMHWFRTFYKNASFLEDATFVSHMVCSGDHRIIEFTKYGVGVESDLSVDDEGSLVYDMRKYVVRTPPFGLIVKFPTWLSPFGGGRTKEIGETEDSFRIEFEMNHPIFGRTVAYTGRCRFESI